MWHTFNIIFSDEGGCIYQVSHYKRSFETKICHFNGISMSLKCRAFMSKMIGVCFITFTGDTCFPVQEVICIQILYTRDTFCFFRVHTSRAIKKILGGRPEFAYIFLQMPFFKILENDICHISYMFNMYL